MLFSKFVRIVPFVMAAATLNAALRDASAPVRIHGGTVVVKSKQHATIFLVRNGDGDGPADHLFQFWANPGLPLDAVYRNADVEYTGAALIVVVPATKTATTFVVKGDKMPAIPLPEGYSTTGYMVTGLNHNNGDSASRYAVVTGHAAGKISPNECTNCDFLPFEDPWGGSGGAGSCSSGGVSASQCSVTVGTFSCSVTCANGYYACCTAGTPPTCSCIAN